MKELKSKLPLMNKDFSASVQDYRSKLEYLFKDPNFLGQVTSIRRKFKIPAYGIKNIQNNFNLFASLMFDNSLFTSLKPKIRRKNRFEDLNAELTNLMSDNDLPERFRQNLRTYVIENKFLLVSNYLARCPLRIYDDGGIIRIFVEIYADTQKTDLIKAWDEIKRVKEEYELKGEHFYKYRDFYLHRLISTGRKPVDAMGMALPGDKFHDLNYDTKNILKSRFRKKITANSKLL